MERKDLRSKDSKLGTPPRFYDTTARDDVVVGGTARYGVGGGSEPQRFDETRVEDRFE